MWSATQLPTDYYVGYRRRKERMKKIVVKLSIVKHGYFSSFLKIFFHFGPDSFDWWNTDQYLFIMTFTPSSMKYP